MEIYSYFSKVPAKLMFISVQVNSRANKNMQNVGLVETGNYHKNYEISK